MNSLTILPEYGNFWLRMLYSKTRKSQINTRSWSSIRVPWTGNRSRKVDTPNSKHLNRCSNRKSSIREKRLPIVIKIRWITTEAMLWSVPKKRASNKNLRGWKISNWPTITKMKRVLIKRSKNSCGKVCFSSIWSFSFSKWEKMKS